MLPRCSGWSAPILVPVEDRGEHLVHIGGCADEEEDDEEERLEVEEGRLEGSIVLASSSSSLSANLRGSGIGHTMVCNSLR